MTISEEYNLDRLFKVLEKAAIAKERCPTYDQLDEIHNIPTNAQPYKLARQGRIRIEIYGKNWRVITILEGPNKGKRTKESPLGGAPYKVL